MGEGSIYYNGHILTMDRARPQATALAVARNRILAVGSDHEILNLADGRTEMIDLAGATICPGFIETHTHLSLYALTLLQVDCSCPLNTTIQEVKERIKAKAQTLEPGQWVKGWGFDDTLIDGKRHLTREDLDECAPVNPVTIDHMSCHLMYANSPALEAAGIGPGTPQPAEGEIGKDELGRPTGLVSGQAQDMISKRIPPCDVGELKAVISEAILHFNSCGITSTHDGSIGYYREGGEVLRAYEELEAEGRLDLRVYLTLVDEFYREILNSGTVYSSNRLKLGSVKLFQDRSIQAFNAALSESYFQKPDIKGELIHSQKELDHLVERCYRLGLQLAIHANGDRAIESCLQALEKADLKYPGQDLRHMIIHCQMATPDHIARMKRLKVIPSYFINHVYYYGDRHLAVFLGPERAHRISPLKSSLRAGLPFTLHSDLPVTPVAPLFAMDCAVNRTTRKGLVLGESERVKPLEALRGYTDYAARCSFEEEIKGTLSPGKLADFVVLSENPLEICPDKIKGIRVLKTVLGGKTVFVNQ